MAKTYDCLVVNPWGIKNKTIGDITKDHLQLRISMSRYEIGFYFYNGGGSIGVNTVPFLENLGYVDPEVSSVHFGFEDPGDQYYATVVYDDGTAYRGVDAVDLSGLDKAIVDYYAHLPSSINIEFSAFIDGETVPTHLTHTVNMDLPDYRYRKISQLVELIETSLGVDGLDSDHWELDANSTIICEENSDSSTSTSTNVVYNHDFSEATVTNEVLAPSAVGVSFEVFQKYASIEEDYNNGTLDIEECNNELRELYNQ